MPRRSDRHAEAPQLSLFGDEEEDSPIDRVTLREPVRPCAVADAVRSLATAVPSWLRLGTSSWTFPGWGPDLVYEREGLSMKHLADRGLEAYAQHPLLRTVGIDRTFYAPMRQDEWAAYRGQVPDDFVPIAKVWSGVTSAVTREGARNEQFLSANRFLDTMWAPAIAGGFDERMPFVFEIPPMRREHEPPVAYLLERLERLLDSLPREGRYSFELRTKSWLVPEYVRLLGRYGASHTMNYWGTMPGLARQWKVAKAACQKLLVVRLMLPPGASYNEQKAAFSPFDREAHAQPGMHDELASVLDELRGVGSPPEVFVIANNKAEGSAPITCRRIAERFVARAGRVTPS